MSSGLVLLLPTPNLSMVHLVVLLVGGEDNDGLLLSHWKGTGNFGDGLVLGMGGGRS